MADSKKRRVALLSNVTVELLAVQLKRDFDLYVPPGYNTWIQEVHDSRSVLYQDEPDAVIALIDGSRILDESMGWAEQIEEWALAIDVLTKHYTSVPIYVSTIDVVESGVHALSEFGVSVEVEFRWFDRIRELSSNAANVYLLDVKRLVTEAGRSVFYSQKMWYLASMPWSRNGLIQIADSIHRAIEAAFDRRRKVVVTDLDNTLWGGVIGEDGLEGIKLSRHGEGQRYRDFQQRLLEMKERGVVLAIASKNNAEDVKEVFDQHPDMILKPDDFAATRINWKSKSENIREISEDLNITLADFVFIDDNPMERGEVGAACPDLVVPDFPDDTSELSGFAERLWIDNFCPLRILDEDANKTEMYRAESKRRVIKREAGNPHEYLKRLEMSAEFHEMTAFEEERVTQLIGKSNQFNLTTKRYTRAEVHALSESPTTRVIVGYMSDAYGDSGLVSVAIVVKEADAATIDSLLMSCRVMGRRFEELAIQSVMNVVTDETLVIGEYFPTQKNAPVKEFYDRLGFTLTSDCDGRKRYELMARDFNTDAASFYKTVSMSGDTFEE